ncbi:MAG: hypothetical protein WKF73_16680 [Nocardioidaceae bacterium]
MEDALRELETALELATQEGDGEAVAMALGYLGALVLGRGEVEAGPGEG